MARTQAAPSGEYTFIRPLAWALLLTLAAISTWGLRHTMNPDGIAYLDMARGVARGDWSQGVNAYWSPLYPWCLGLALRVFGASPFREFTVAHIVNFLFFVAALAAFELCLKESLRARARIIAAEPPAHVLPEWLCKGVAYAAFGWSTLVVIGVGFVTPDLALAAFLYLTAGILLRLHNHGSAAIWYPALGATLAIGFLTKAAMLPLSIVLLALAPVASQRFRSRDIAAALVCFVVLAAPFVIALSRQKDRLTFGDTGKLNYAWYVNGVQLYKHWQGEPEGSGTPLHPSRLIYATPATYEFGQPIAGTYPVWNDPSYWYEGVHVHLAPIPQLRRLLNELRQLPWMLADLFIAIAGFVVLLLRKQLKLHLRLLALSAIPALAAIIMYSLVHLELRFIGAFLGFFVVGCVVTLQPRTSAAREATLVVWCALSLLFAFRVTQTGLAAVGEIREQVASGRNAHTEWRAASELRRAGLRPGEEVAVIGNSFRSYWAHLGGYRIVGEIGLNAYNEASPTQRQGAITALRAHRIREIIMVTRNGCDSKEGWIRVSNTRLCRYMAGYSTPATAGRH